MIQQYFLIAICHLQNPLSIAAIWMKQRRFTGIDEVKLGPALCALIAHLSERRHCLVQPDPAGSGCPGARSRPPAVFYPGEAAPRRFLYSVQRTAGVKHRGFHGLAIRRQVSSRAYLFVSACAWRCAASISRTGMPGPQFSRNRTALSLTSDSATRQPTAPSEVSPLQQRKYAGFADVWDGLQSPPVSRGDFEPMVDCRVRSCRLKDSSHRAAHRCTGTQLRPAGPVRFICSRSGG